MKKKLTKYKFLYLVNIMIFKLLFYSIRNYSPNIPITPLGRWNRNCNVDSSTFLTNRDHCGDLICGNMKYTKKYLEDVFKEKKIKKEN